MKINIGDKFRNKYTGEVFEVVKFLPKLRVLMSKSLERCVFDYSTIRSSFTKVLLS